MLNGTFSSRLKIVITTLGDFVQRSGGQISTDQQIQIQAGMQSLESLYQQVPAKDVTLEYVADPSNTGSSIVKSIISNVADSFYYEVLGVRSNLNLQEESIVERRFSAVDYYLPGLIAAFVMTNGVIGVTTNTTEFKRRGILKRLATTPLSRLEWILGNVFTQAALSFLLVAVMITISWAAFGLQAIPDALTLLLIIVGSILFSGMGLLLAGLISDVEAASAAGNAVSFPMMFLSGSFWPIEIMPHYLQQIARTLPLTYFTDGLRSSLIYHHTPSALINLGIVAALALIFIMIGSVLTRWREK
jgi:ABC-2 type transport system permease protein